METELDRKYNDMALSFVRGEKVDGLKPKPGCSFCYGQGLVTRLQPEITKDGAVANKRIKQPCACILKRLNTMQRQEEEQLRRSTAPAPLAPQPTPAPSRIKDATKKLRQRQQTVEARKAKLATYLEELAILEDQKAMALNGLDTKAEELMAKAEDLEALQEELAEVQEVARRAVKDIEKLVTEMLHAEEDARKKVVLLRREAQETTAKVEKVVLQWNARIQQQKGKIEGGERRLANAEKHKQKVLDQMVRNGIKATG